MEDNNVDNKEKNTVNDKPKKDIPIWLALLVFFSVVGIAMFAMQKYADFKLENHPTTKMLQEREEGFERLKNSIEETGQMVQEQKDWIEEYEKSKNSD